jgi:hypothetical protein
MPENDPFEPLDNFPEGLHVNAMPASEVRRRGDRMRRRNTALAAVGGVVAAAVFIGVPVALMSGDDKDTVDPAPPVPSRTEDPQPGWLTEIPEEFPLADGFPETNGLDGSPTEVTSSTGYTGLGCAGITILPPQPADLAGITYTGESEDTANRTLYLMQDDIAAADYLALVDETLRGCPQSALPDGEQIYESAIVDLDLGTESSLVVAQQVRGDDGLLSQLTVTEIGQTGNAIHVEQSYGSAAGPQVIGFETERLRERSARPLAALCVFAADPCSTTEVTPDPETSSSTPVEGGTAAIPADFPIAEGMDESADSDVEGPGPDVKAGPVVDVCGTEVWAPSGVLQRLAVRETGIEYLETRELTTFISSDEPADSLTQVRDAVSACARLDGESYGYTTRMLSGPDGYDSFSWGYFADEGLDGGVFQLTRVGSSVLVVYAAGEMSESSLQPTADNLTETTLAIVPEMCLFTEDGC